jgi:2-polyprenyl-6-methoxyphenol hydroxylase-like FAD-dependent oxidoreductase
MENKSVLISGMGIAGPALAYWLRRYGFEPTLVERAPSLRTSGYVIDFWGLGYEIAEKMGLIPEITHEGYHVQEVRIVDKHGKRVAGFSTKVIDELTGGRFITIGRSDLSRLIFNEIEQSCEVRFGDSIQEIHEEVDGVRATFEHGGEEKFDLVIGADGLHSVVRKLAFGAQEQYEKYLGYVVAAFEANGYQPRDEDVYVTYNEAGKEIGRLALRDDRTLFLLILAHDLDANARPHGIDAQKAFLREEFAGQNWELPQVRDALDSSRELYFDRVSQIRMDEWSRGRVALVGDAAYCVSLLAGQGSALAMIGAYLLAAELAKAQGDYQNAFRRYEELLRPYIDKKQKAAANFAGSFAPKTNFGLVVRNFVMNSFGIPGLAKYTIGRDISDQLKLPEYAEVLA